MPLIHRFNPYACTLRCDYTAINFIISLADRGYRLIGPDHRLEPMTFRFRREKNKWLFEWIEETTSDQESDESAGGYIML